ncbi:MAG: phage baseplate plug family protein [Cetobacterium sp.]
MEILDIKNTDIPLTQKIKINDKTFILDIVYRKFDDRLICNLYNEFGDELGSGEKMMFGVPLFYHLYKDVSGNLNKNMPDKYIVPNTEDGKEKVVNIKNFSNKVFLYLMDVI